MRRKRKLLAMLTAAVMALVLGCTPSPADNNPSGKNPPNPVKLSTPLLVSFDSTTSVLSWLAVQHANLYGVRVLFRRDGELLLDATTTSNELAIDEELFRGKSGFVYFYVKALAHEHYTESNEQEIWWHRSLQAVSMVQNLAFDHSSGVLSYTLSANADSYTISYTYNGQSGSVQTTEDSYDFGELFDGITPVSFSVVASRDDIDFADSAAATLTSYITLSAPDGLEYSGGKMGFVTWNAVENATSYEFYYEHVYMLQSGLSNSHRSPTDASSDMFHTTTQTSYQIVLYTSHPAARIRFVIRARATGYQPSSFTEYNYYFPT